MDRLTIRELLDLPAASGKGGFELLVGTAIAYSFDPITKMHEILTELAARGDLMSTHGIHHIMAIAGEPQATAMETSAPAFSAFVLEN
jgi:hypothetical protein